MTVFRPSAQALIWIRVDELADTQQFDQRVAAQQPSRSHAQQRQPATATVSGKQLTDPAQALTDLVTARHQLEQNRADGQISEAEYEMALRQNDAQREIVLQEQQSSPNQPRPWMLLGASPDRRYGRFGIQPLNVEIQKNGYRTADTATMTIDWRTLPFDPRIVRAAACEIVVGVVDENRFTAGMSGQLDPLTGLPVSVIDQNPGAPDVQSGTRFCGWVDEWGISYDDDDYTVELQFRDFTALFIDTPLSSDATLNLDLPIDKGISALLAQYPTLADFAVRYVAVPGRPDDGVPAPVLGHGIPPTSRSRRGRNARSGRSGDQRMSLWDHITDACVALGLVPVVRDYELQIVEPVTQYRTTNVRRMVFGRNLSMLDFSRKLGGTKVPTIEVRAYDPVLGRTRWARWPVRPGESATGVLGVDLPPRPLRANEMTPTGVRVDERIQTYVLAPNTDPQIMLRAARSLFEQIGRQEIEGNFETFDVSSWDIEQDQARDVWKTDLLAMHPGDAIEILVAPQDPRRPEDAASTPGEWVALERAARARFLEGLGMTRVVAENIAELQDVVGGLLFRVQDVHINFDVDEGLKVKCDFANFIEVRETRPASARALQLLQLSSPDARARASAMIAAGLDDVVDSVLSESKAREATTLDAMTGEVTNGQPVPGAPRTLKQIEQSIENETALNQIIDGLLE